MPIHLKALMGWLLVGGCCILLPDCSSSTPGCTYDTDCPDFQVCRNGSCVAISANCDDVTCNPGWHCEGGLCVQDDPCANVTCNTPPKHSCSDLHTLVSYSDAGTCEKGDCHYYQQVTNCEGLCDKGSCVADPCKGVVCTDPPSNFCQDVDTLIAYTSPGQCQDGDCSYQSQPVTCQFGCQDNQCQGDVCSGVNCTTPPDPVCLDQTNLCTFESQGTCVAGTGLCNYDCESTEVCDFGCAQGACKPDPCVNVTCDDPPTAHCSSQNPDDLVQYQATGQCSGGDCYYNSSTQHCDYGCSVDNCLSCTPDCAGKCGGASNGCPNGTCDVCPGNAQYCVQQVCVDCQDDQHCGVGCANCQGSGLVCIEHNNNWFCGCTQLSQCASNEVCNFSSYMCEASPTEFGNMVVAPDGCEVDGQACPTNAIEFTGTGGGFSRFTVKRPIEVRTMLVESGVLLSPVAWRSNVVDSGIVQLYSPYGWIEIQTGARIDASGLGYGGGGGGGGSIYCDGNYCNAVDVSTGGGEGGPLDGSPGDAPKAIWDQDCHANGGAGGGFGGTSGQTVDRSVDGCNVVGFGGRGAGNHGGIGGGTPGASEACDNWGKPPAAPGMPGTPGGYLGEAMNGETNADSNDDVYMGSGGGGGSGGISSGGYCCGGGVGGAGGVSSNTSTPTCSSGGAGSGGGAGGGMVSIIADELRCMGEVFANGAGEASLNAGYGAGGGILLIGYLISIGEELTIRSLGGNMNGNGVITNGGTVKIRAVLPVEGIADRIVAGLVSIVIQ